MRFMTLRAIPTAMLCAMLALAQAPVANADPPPVLPPNPFLPNTGFAPGGYGYLYPIFIVPPPPTVDARGVRATVGINEDTSEKEFGMPGSRLGNSRPVDGILTATSMQRFVSIGGNDPIKPVAGVNAAGGVNSLEEDNRAGRHYPLAPDRVDGQQAELLPPESTPPVGRDDTYTPPALQYPGGRSFGVTSRGAD
jgi:hypothetical protein